MLWRWEDPAQPDPKWASAYPPPIASAATHATSAGQPSSGHTTYYMLCFGTDNIAENASFQLSH